MTASHTRLFAAIEKFEAARAELEGSTGWYKEKLGGYIEALFTRFAPFKPGDRVILKQAPVILGPDHGWWSSKQFLIPGALGIVREVDYDHGAFTALVEWENQTRLDQYGVARAVSAPSLYHFTEETIEKTAIKDD